MPLEYTSDEYIDNRITSKLVRVMLSNNKFVELKKRHIKELLSEVCPEKLDSNDLESIAKTQIDNTESSDYSRDVDKNYITNLKESNINRGIVLLSRKIFGPFLLGAFPLTYDVTMSYRKFDNILSDLGISKTRRDTVRIIKSLNNKDLHYTNSYSRERRLYFTKFDDEVKERRYVRIRLFDNDK